MSINEVNNTELIDLYLSGQLEGEELSDFKLKLSQDPSFAQEVTLQDKIGQAIINNERSTMQKQMDELHGALEADESHQGNVRKLTFWSNPMRWSAAAALAILILGVGYYATFNGPSTQYLPIELPDGVRGEIQDNLGEIVVTIIDDNSQYNKHYTLGDTLTLYGDFDHSDLKVFINPNPNFKGYVLQLGNGQLYPLKNTSELTPIGK